MKKLKLNLDEIKVESFETNTIKSMVEGTVHGNVSGKNPAETCLTCAYTCEGVTCVYTCANTCPNTCGYTCDDPTCPGQGVTCYAHCTDPQFTDPTTACDCP